jgi:hypothetical protein
MKISEKPTDYILIQARTSSEWDEVAFALIHLDDDFKETIKKRKDLVENTYLDDFYYATFWDCPVGFYTDSDDEGINQDIDDIIHKMDKTLKTEWVFVETTDDEIDTLNTPNSILDGHQMKVKPDEFWYYAEGKHNGDDKFWTDRISFADIDFILE